MEGGREDRNRVLDFGRGEEDWEIDGRGWEEEREEEEEEEQKIGMERGYWERRKGKEEDRRTEGK